MASDAGYNENDFNVWPDNHQSGMYPEFDFIDSTTQDPYTDFSVLANEMIDERYDSEVESAEDEDSAFGSSTIDAAAWFGDKEFVQGHSMATELRPGEKFN